ncbi:MAG: DUF2726 domain-containing protein [Bacillota bacterium]|nr:DUF2726 domain-containing protein [Bacillota bacterium]
MAQLIGVAILFVIGKVILDYVKDQGNSTKRTKNKKSGEVIDLSEAWINTGTLPYHLRDYPLNNRELAVYELLNNLLEGSNYTINVKMRMADLLTLPMQTSNYQEYMNRIKERTLDIVILESPRLKPVLVVNVESQKDHKKKQLADQFRDNALTTAGLANIYIDPNGDQNDSSLLQSLRSAGLAI